MEGGGQARFFGWEKNVRKRAAHEGLIIRLVPTFFFADLSVNGRIGKVHYRKLYLGELVRSALSTFVPTIVMMYSELWRVLQMSTHSSS